jgi:hypothetical protein
MRHLNNNIAVPAGCGSRSLFGKDAPELIVVYGPWPGKTRFFTQGYVDRQKTPHA